MDSLHYRFINVVNMQYIKVLNGVFHILKDWSLILNKML